ncbi:hypothetical protein D9M71_424460 [compost metagenome]
MNFIKLCMSGEVLVEEIDDLVAAWHEGTAGEDQELHELLGMDWEEYSAWATTPSILPFIISARRKKISLEEELQQDRYALAARASSAAEATKIEDWLRRMGELD